MKWRRENRMERTGGLTAVVLLLLVACGSPGGNDKAGQTAALDRAVVITTSACGTVLPTTGSGVAVAPGRVLTAAHVVIGAGSVNVATAGNLATPAIIIRLDTKRDLALLAVPDVEVAPVELGNLDVDQVATIVGSASSGDVSVVVKRKVNMSAQEVRSTQQVQRKGYELNGRTTTGDSGAGVFDSQQRLVGVVFANATDGSATVWALASDEISAVLDGETDAVFGCDPSQSRVTKR